MDVSLLDIDPQTRRVVDDESVLEVARSYTSAGTCASCHRALGRGGRVSVLAEEWGGIGLTLRAAHSPCTPPAHRVGGQLTDQADGLNYKAVVLGYPVPGGPPPSLIVNQSIDTAFAFRPNDSAGAYICAPLPELESVGWVDPHVATDVSTVGIYEVSESGAAITARTVAGEWTAPLSDLLTAQVADRGLTVVALHGIEIDDLQHDLPGALYRATADGLVRLGLLERS